MDIFILYLKIRQCFQSLNYSQLDFDYLEVALLAINLLVVFCTYYFLLVQIRSHYSNRFRNYICKLHARDKKLAITTVTKYPMQTYIRTQFDGFQQVLLQNVISAAFQHDHQVAGCRGHHKVQLRLLHVLAGWVHNYLVVYLAYSAGGKAFVGLCLRDMI